MSTARALAAIREQGGSTRGPRETWTRWPRRCCCSTSWMRGGTATRMTGAPCRDAAPRSLGMTVCFVLCRLRRARTPHTEPGHLPPGATFGAVTDSLAAHGVIAHRLVSSCWRGCAAWTGPCRPGSTSSPPGTRLEGARRCWPMGRRPPLAVHRARRAHHRGGRVARRGAARHPARTRSLAAARDSAAASALLGYPVPLLRGIPPARRPISLPRTSAARELVRVMAEGFKADWKPAWDARLDSLGMTQLQLVTLASIVEGEARADEERETIAGVYHNRLRIGMALQADPDGAVRHRPQDREAEDRGSIRRTTSSVALQHLPASRPAAGPGQLTQPAQHRGVALPRQGALSVLRGRTGRPPRVLPDLHRAPAGDRAGCDEEAER